MFNVFNGKERLKNEYKLWDGYSLEHWLNMSCLFLVFLRINGSVQNTRGENSQGKTLEFGLTITQVRTTTDYDEQTIITLQMHVLVWTPSLVCSTRG